MSTRIAIINIGMGNLHSVYKALKNHQPFITNDPKELLAADKLILPGVGHFKKAMESLAKDNLLDALNEAVLVQQKPILGICLGMQLMAKESEEGNAKGLGWFEQSRVTRFRPTPDFKVPHMGWNTIEAVKESNLLKSIPSGSEFYFAHTYYWETSYSVETLTETNYILSFSSAIERDNIYGVQFHPEKSHENGLRLLESFSAM